MPVTIDWDVLSVYAWMTASPLQTEGHVGNGSIYHVQTVKTQISLLIHITGGGGSRLFIPDL